MTKQEMFNRVRAHLLAQNKRSARLTWRGTQCAYRSHDGLKCAIGCLIPDEHYLPSMEGMPIHEIRLRHVREAAGITAELLPLAIELQQVHDYHCLSDWRKSLRHLAVKFGLAVPP